MTQSISTNINPQQYRYFSTNYSYEMPVHREAPRNQLSGETKSLITFGVLQALTMFLQKASNWCGQKLMQGKEFTNAQNVDKIASKMLADNNLSEKVAVEYISPDNIRQVAQKYSHGGILKELEPVARGENAFYADSLKLAVAPKGKPSLILHELGHAITAHKGKLLQYMQKSRSKIANLPPMLLLLNTFLQKNNKEKTFIEKYAGLIGFCAFLPTIIEEGIASMRGINAAKNFKKTVDKTINLKALKRNYGFAWLTYLIAGAVFGIGAKISVMESGGK